MSRANTEIYSEGDHVVVSAEVPDNGQPADLAQRLIPLHAAGTVVEGINSVAEALALGGLDWEVGTRSVATLVEGGEDGPQWAIEADWQATYRKDTLATLGLVGRNYRAFQNADSFAPLQALVDEGRLRIEAVGGLRGGRIPFMVAALPGASFEIAGEQHDTRLLLMTSHDGSHMLKGITIPMRLYCLNMLRVVLSRGASGSGNIRFRHTSGGLANAGERTRMLHVAMEYTARLATYSERLAQQPMGAKALGTFLQHLIPNPKGVDEDVARQVQERRDAVRSLYISSPNLENIRGTAWAAFNAVAEYVDYQMPSRDTRLGGRVENKAMSVIDGQGAILKQTAWDLLVARKAHKN